MKHLILAAAALALSLGACGDTGDGREPRARAIKAGSPYVDKLKTLSALNRGLALRRAIQDSGERCKKTDASGYQEDYKNMSMWTARCSDTGDWAIFIAPNADVQVRACADLAQIKLPACRIAGTP